MKNRIRLILAAGLCMAALSCGQSGRTGAVVYESEDKKIKVYESEVNSELNRNLASNGVEAKDVPKDQLEALKLRIIQGIAMNRALAMEGKKQKLDNADFKNSLKLAEEELLATSAVLNKMNKVEVTEEETKAYYEAYKSTNFTRPEESARLQVIILPSTELAKAEEALKEAKAAPDKFGDAVKKYNPQANANGEIQETPFSALGPIAEPVKEASNGQVIDKVIQAGDLLYVVKVLEKFPQGVVEYEKVKEAAKAQLKASKRKQEQEKYLQEMSKEYKIDKITKDTVKLPAAK